ncbi:hypothetical protein MHM84_04060 [Halomonas sp. McH1-25]|uniref:hypothetical protein n=1 Tax=unclassified Halomonas TaxID=2609666 RepID=UPI001EF6D45E|nr:MULTISPECIES: hypothetical protein [unclassified Halomonas]MCG7598949.1 hypothetical protein [Halomonas sp. McH1-25]MCP1342447.1 hypothetical protein [Halomonas sp. FL8]MCP1362029.1 hypothetical protein [Halomonas sp. BBD45]MCP1366826.1 hypothetical protein [Halomonas sp. BBD48]
MTCANPSTTHEERPTRRRTRWWLAGLLVGCLLPAGLVHAEALRLAERLTQICLMAPDAIRAQSRRVARRKARRCLPSHVSLPCRPVVPACRPAMGVPCAGQDVLNRRGPPQAQLA